MLIFFDQNLVFFAVPKTGTTAYEAALRARADIIFRKRPALKHINARKFDRQLAPYLAKAHGLAPERMAVLRHPLDQLRSWYKYRHKPSLIGTPNSTRGISFPDFVSAHLQEEPPDFASVGRQHRFVTSPKGDLRIDHLFAVESPLALHEFLADRFGKPVKVPVRNVSPKIEIDPLPADLMQRYEAERAPDLELHEQVLSSGGHLHTPL